jgi:hypothetical protein
MQGPIAEPNGRLTYRAAPIKGHDFSCVGSGRDFILRLLPRHLSPQFPMQRRPLPPLKSRTAVEPALPRTVRRITSAVALAVCALLVACTTDRYSFVDYGSQINSRTGEPNYKRELRLNDALALNYASSVVALLRAKYTGARITREISSVAQLGLAAAAAYGAAFNYSKSTLAVLGLGSAGVPELQRIFGAKERAQTYQDAIRLIEEAEVDYLAHNPKPSADELTPNGVTLFQRVTASIHVVEKTLAGNLPSMDDMKKATERMTPSGAVPHEAGDEPTNLINATGEEATGKLERDEIVARRHNLTLTRNTTPPPPTEIVVFRSKTLQTRNDTLETAFSKLTEDEAKKLLDAKSIVIPPGGTPREVLAQAVLDNAALTPKLGLSAVASLKQYREAARDDASTARLENAYRAFNIPLTAGDSRLRPRNIALREAFEDLSDQEVIAALGPSVESSPAGGKPREVLAAKILKTANLPRLSGETAVASVTSYRIKANASLSLTNQLEAAFRTLKLKGFGQ